MLTLSNTKITLDTLYSSRGIIDGVCVVSDEVLEEFNNFLIDISINSYKKLNSCIRRAADEERHVTCAKNSNFLNNLHGRFEGLYYDATNITKFIPLLVFTYFSDCDTCWNIKAFEDIENIVYFSRF